MTNDDMILNYLESSMDVAYQSQSPIFTISWATTVSHDDINGIRHVDIKYSSFLTRLIDKGYMDNTILIFMGDHGYRFGKFRESLLGYFEDKLPNMWITLPPRVQKRFPEWQRSLEINSK
jgi:membrane-anchored protein YejM (alkaline phosphatase superfamily)